MAALITGLGAVSALGRGIDRLRQAMETGEHGIQPIERFATDDFDVRLAGVVPDRNHRSWSGSAGSSLCIDFAIDAAREAWCAAGLDRAGPGPERIALVMGTSLGDQRGAAPRDDRAGG